MICIKTGFHGFLEEYGLFVYGDAFAEQEFSGALALRISDVRREPLIDRLDLIVNGIGQWFERFSEEPKVQTIIVSSGKWIKTGGYEGIKFEYNDGIIKQIAKGKA